MKHLKVTGFESDKLHNILLIPVCNRNQFTTKIPGSIFVQEPTFIQNSYFDWQIIYFGLLDCLLNTEEKKQPNENLENSLNTTSRGELYRKYQ